MWCVFIGRKAFELINAKSFSDFITRADWFALHMLTVNAIYFYHWLWLSLRDSFVQVYIFSIPTIWLLLIPPQINGFSCCCYDYNSSLFSYKDGLFSIRSCFLKEHKISFTAKHYRMVSFLSMIGHVLLFFDIAKSSMIIAHVKRNYH